MKHILLLGAGASAPADVPTAYAMTERIVRKVRSRQRDRLGYVLSYVVGQLIAEASRQGYDPLYHPDIEKVFNAVDVLGSRHNREVNAFVSSWHQTIQNIEAAERDGLGFDDDIYDRLKRELRRHLIHLTWLTDPSRVEYLGPIAELALCHPGVVIATLNYDNTIELLADSRNIPCSHGLDGWFTSGRFDRATDGITLLKLHGSIDWTWDTGYPPRDNPIPTKALCPVAPADVSSGNHDPAVIFGHHNKLTAEGPFLDLLGAFWREALNAEIITVIGYSFRDPHINEYLRRWINMYPNRQMRVVDPGFAGTADIIRRMWESDEAFTLGLWKYHHGRLDDFGRSYQTRILSVPVGLEALPSNFFA